MTVQQKVHTLVVLLCAVRAAYFLLAVDAWDPESGRVVADAGVFYTLDEFSTLFFFSLACILALFWAELYYIAVDREQVFVRCVRPATYSFNIVAYAATALGAFFSSILSDEQVDYTFWYYSLVVSVTYISSAAIFAYFAIGAAREIDQIPIHMEARQQRLHVLQLLASIFISALVVRSVVVLCLMGVDVVTVSRWRLFLLGAYFLLSEVLPIATAVGFYRIERIHASDCRSADDPMERSALLGSWGGASLGAAASPSVAKSRDEVVASIIDRLSADAAAIDCDRRL